MHLKRNNIKKFFPIARKGTKYVARSDHSKNSSIPLVVAMRDILKLVKNKKELKKTLNEKHIKINGKIIRETNYPLELFDILTLNSGKNYRALLTKQKKINFEEIKEKEASTKVFKVLNKKVLAGKLIQLNLTNGKNIISKEKVNTGDSIVLDMNGNKILKIINLEKGKHAFVTEGKHAGEEGKIEELIERGGKKLAKINVGGSKGEDKSSGTKINVWVKNLIVMEK